MGFDTSYILNNKLPVELINSKIEFNRMAYPITQPQKLTLPGHDGQGIHPSIVYIQSPGIGGYTWWMAYTPYQDMNARDENPTILASYDGVNWVEPAGIINPIAPDPGAPKFNRDPVLIHDGDNKQLICYWVEADPNGTGQTYRKTSSNGVTWSSAQPVNIAFGAFALARLAPNNWLAWDSTVYSRTQPRYRSADGITFWSETTGRTNLDGHSLHLDAYVDAEGYHFLSSPYRNGGSNNYDHGIRYGFSPDGENIVFDSVPLLSPQIGNSGSWFRDIIYKSCIVRIADGIYRVYLSGITGTKTHIGYMDIKINLSAWSTQPWTGKLPGQRRSIRLINAGQIRDTTAKYINLGQFVSASSGDARISDWAAFENHALVFRNSHDQSITLVMTYDASTDYFSTAQTVNTVAMPANQPNRPTYVDSRHLANLSGLRPFDNIGIYLTATTAPTTGSVTVDLVMWN